MNDLDSPEGLYCHKMIDESVKFEISWFDKTEKEIKEKVAKKSKNDFVFIQFSYLELGKDEAWFEKQKRKLNNDLLKIKRELLLEWTLSSDNSPFTEEQLNEIEKYVVNEPLFTLPLYDDMKINIYSKLTNMLNKSWIVSVDIGGGLGKDYTVITITDPLDYKIKGVFRDNSLQTLELEKLLEFIITEYFPNCVIIPERNSLAIPLIEIFVKNPIIRKHLYYETKEVIGERKIEDPRVNKSRKFKTTTKVYGVATTAQSRKIMIKEILNYIVNECPYCITSPELFSELKKLQRKSGGRIEAAPGAHDDCIMSYLIGLYGLMYGNSINKLVKVTSNFVGTNTNPNSKKIANKITKLENIVDSNFNGNEMQSFLQSSGSKLYQEEKMSKNSKLRKIKNLIY